LLPAACDCGNPRKLFRLVSSENSASVQPGDVCKAGLRLFMNKVALVVDDSMLIRYTVCRFLEQRGYAVESAVNGVEALEILARVQPTLIVTDMQMPKMSGSELITALKSKPETAGIPIIIVAARASGFDKTETRANFAVYKDIDIEAQLVKALDALAVKAGALAAGK